MSYAKQASVESGLRFRSPSELLVETTGRSVFVESHSLHVHEVVVLEGPGQGTKFLLNLDAAKPITKDAPVP